MAAGKLITALTIIFINSAKIFATPADDAPPERAHHALIYDESNECVLLTAGSTPVNSGQSYIFYNDLWCFDGNQWTKMGVAGDERSGVTLAYDSKRKKIYSFGGYANGNSLNDLRVLEGNQWKTIAILPEMKASEPGLVYDAARDRLVLFGGSAGRGKVNNETWEWDGTAWIKFNGTSPEGRQAFTMIYDTKRKKTVLYGGMGTESDSVFDDTWEYDGIKWSKVADIGPGARSSAGFAYDEKRGMFLIFGGYNKSTLADTWGWDGKRWKKLADSGPSARVMGFMAYHKKRDRIILFGGRPGWPNDANDTWEWNGTQWREIK